MNNKVNKNNILNIIFIILWIIFFSVIFYISWINWVLKSILIFIVYSIIAFIFYFLWKRIRKKEYLSFDKFIFYFFKKVLVWIYISIFIVWTLAYYSNEISPAAMPTYTISNWNKTVIFQTMSHIWSEDFYEQVRQNLIKAKKQWYVYYFEWVRDWSEKNKQAFNKAIWIKFDQNLYKNFSKLYWVVHQDNSIYFNLVNNLDFNVDLSIDEIMQYYKKPTMQNNKNTLLQNKEVIDVNAEIIKTLARLNEKELKILRYINQAILNFMISSEKTQNLITNNFWNTKLMSIILGKRNELLSEKIINSEHKKIFITYWLLHFRWVLELLKEDDKNWRIIKTNYLYPIN